MLFASTELAARIERAECHLLEGGARALRARAGEEAVFTRAFGGGWAACSDGSSPLDKVAGLGFEGPIAEDELAEIERAFHGRGVAVQVELATLADVTIGRLLSQRGYVLQGHENVLACDLAGRADAGAAGRAQGSISIEPSEGDDFESWLDVVVTGFAHPDAQGVAHEESFPRDALANVIRDMASQSGFARQLARIDGVPAGAASMRIDGAIAQLCGAATLPAFRRRGVQSALLDVRLESAREQGCELAVVATAPGSKSQENVQRRGFELLYARTILTLAPPGADR